MTELLAVVTQVRRLFAPGEIRKYLDQLERAKYLAPPDPDLEMDDLDEIEEEPWLGNPVLGAAELLRFSRTGNSFSTSGRPHRSHTETKKRPDPGGLNPQSSHRGRLWGRKSRPWDGITTWKTKLRFPFQARCIASKVISPLRKGETVEVRRIAPDDACSSDIVRSAGQGRNMAVPLSQLAAIDTEESTIEAVGDWHHWVAQDNCF